MMPLGTEVGLGPWWHSVTWGGGPDPPKKEQSPNFRPMSVMAKRLDG